VRIAARRDADRVVIDVEDSAPGVPADALPRLFDRFYRVEDSRSRANGGAGLGLAIVRSVVEAHGGTIDAGRSPLGGLRVSIAVPAAS
jgi:two-component system, OmpR family, sensor histidine kinase BaeS